jgi:hypothetical protein
MRIARTLALAVLPAFMACSDDSPQEPKLCLFTADLAASLAKDPSAVQCADVEQKQAQALGLAPQEVYYVRHELPVKVTPPGPVHLHIGTACGTAGDLDVDYGKATKDGTAAADLPAFALIARVAPPGAECSLTVTATIANSSITRSTRPTADAAACAKLACPAADAGAGGSTTTTTATSSTGTGM